MYQEHGDPGHPGSETARQHIHLEFYIWHNDPTGREFLDALVRAAKRGVEVRLLVDEVGSIELNASGAKGIARSLSSDSTLSASTL